MPEQVHARQKNIILSCMFLHCYHLSASDMKYGRKAKYWTLIMLLNAPS